MLLKGLLPTGRGTKWFSRSLSVNYKTQFSSHPSLPNSPLVQDSLWVLGSRPRAEIPSAGWAATQLTPEQRQRVGNSGTVLGALWACSSQQAFCALGHFWTEANILARTRKFQVYLLRPCTGSRVKWAPQRATNNLQEWIVSSRNHRPGASGLTQPHHQGCLERLPPEGCFVSWPWYFKFYDHSDNL